MKIKSQLQIFFPSFCGFYNTANLQQKSKRSILYPKLHLLIEAQMKFVSPDIAWHGQRQRILSIDFHPFTNELVTAGSQQKQFSEEKESDFFSGCIKFWQLNFDNLNHPECKYGMTEVTSSVNVVKYSSDGRFLAAATDYKQIIIYVQKESNRSLSSQQTMFKWTSFCKFFGHGQDVIDLAWSKNSQYLVSASMDGTVRFWQMELSKRKDCKVIGYFEKAVQGVAIHPNIEYVIGVGNDQVAKLMGPSTAKKGRIYDNWYAKRTFQKYSFKRGVIQNDEIDKEEEKTQSFKMFANQSVASFFRRPCVSPDGQLFILPCGIWKNSPSDDPKCCAYLFRKNYCSIPSFSILTNKQPVLICKFCPFLFKKTNPQQGLFKQPYYMVFAVATTNSVLIYNTDSLKPLFGMGNFHYAALTDISWKDDQLCAVSSSDGFISFFTFQQGQLGEIYEPQQGLLKEMITRTPYVAPIKVPQTVQQNVQKMVPEQNQQQTITIETATGVKKKIIPKIISKPTQ